MNVIQKLRQLHGEIATAKDGLKVVDAWTLAQRLASRLPIDQTEATRVFKEKDALGLDMLIAKLENPKQVETTEAAEISPQEQDRALKAFRKRLKIQRLADESRLGGRYTSGGRTSKIDAIIPPDDFPAEVWKALAKSGKLKNQGRGFYSEP